MRRDNRQANAPGRVVKVEAGRGARAPDETGVTNAADVSCGITPEMGQGGATTARAMDVVQD